MESEEIRRLRYVVIGVGAGVFSMHAPALRQPFVHLVGVCDIREEIGQQRAAMLGAPFYAGYRQMVDELKPDVAVVITPHYNHAEIASYCLEAGCNVLVEKPMALEVAEADAMISAAQRSGKLLAVNFQHRQRPEVRAARKLIQDGRLGKLQRLDMVTPWPRSAAYYAQASWRATWPGEGGGVLMNQAPHDLDLACHLMGRPAAVVAWTRTALHKIEVEDTATALLSWNAPDGAGATGYLHVSTAEAGPREDIEIVGSGGILKIGMGTLSFDEYDHDVAEFLLSTPGVWSKPDAHPIEVALEEGAGDHHLTGDHPAVYRNFYAAITEGAPIGADGQSARMSLELANAIILSSKTRSEVRLPVDRGQYHALLANLKAGRKPT
jgi:predicted dehydrogenase